MRKDISWEIYNIWAIIHCMHHNCHNTDQAISRKGKKKEIKSMTASTGRRNKSQYNFDFIVSSCYNTSDNNLKFSLGK